MTTNRLLAAAAILIAIALVTTPSLAQGYVKARLGGYQEVPPISTPANGMFAAKIDKDTGAMEWELSYDGIESAATEAHIHFGQPGVNGGVIALLCSNLGGGVPPCPETEGMVSGLIDETSITGPADQGIEAGELREALMAILSGATYVNVHTEAFPSGEIRGQLRRGFGGGRDGGLSGDTDDPETEGSTSDRSRGNDKSKDNNKDKDKDKDKGGD